MSKECANCGNERIMLCPFCEHDFSEASKQKDAELLALRETVRVLGEECKYSREHLVSAPHPDTDAPPTCPYFELNTLATQADDCNIADARAATNANPIAFAAVEKP